ncbi:MAG: hypothetical protein ACYSU7_18880 [Planctomycetota bacterium]|jgi:hypothetical protein
MFVNRWGILVWAKQPYVDWANSFEDGGPMLSLDDQRSSPTLYLIPELEGADLYELVDEWYWQDIFAFELSSWMRDLSDWPENRTADMFHEWFDVELISELIDLGQGRIKTG